MGSIAYLSYYQFPDGHPDVAAGIWSIFNKVGLEDCKPLALEETDDNGTLVAGKPIDLGSSTNVDALVNLATSGRQFAFEFDNSGISVECWITIGKKYPNALCMWTSRSTPLRNSELAIDFYGLLGKFASSIRASYGILTVDSANVRLTFAEGGSEMVVDCSSLPRGSEVLEIWISDQVCMHPLVKGLSQSPIKSKQPGFNVWKYY